MNATGLEGTLRPLALGEILDRAVTLCVKYFVPLTTIYVVYLIPLAIVSYFATKDLQQLLQTIGGMLQGSAASGRPADSHAIARALAAAGPLNGWGLLSILMAGFIAPLPTAALIEATSATYLGRAPSFAQAYRVGLTRWLPLIGINVLYVLAGALLYVALGLAVAFVFFGLAFLTVAMHGVGVALDIAIGLAVALSMFAFIIVVVLAVQVSYFTCVVEGAGVVSAFSRGVSRVFVGVGLRRSLLVAIAFVAIGIGIAMVSLIGESVLVGLLHNAFAGTVFSAAVRIATAAFTTAFIAIFYFDLRVREEGLDLTLAADRLPTDSLATT